MPTDTVYVGRPTRWGNPFWVEWEGAGWCVTLTGGEHYSGPTDKRSAADLAVKLYVTHLGLFQPDDINDYLAPLRGKNLACWCPLDGPCHADVLLDWASRCEAVSEP